MPSVEPVFMTSWFRRGIINRNMYTPMFVKLLGELNEIAGQWNGDESGAAEDAAHAAIEAAEKVNELSALLEDLNIA